jgi:hypothetical protein
MELGTVLERHSDDAADHLHRVLRRDGLYEVGTPGGRDVVEQPRDRRANQLRVPPLERRGPEGMRDEVAVGAMLAPAHRQDELAHELSDVLGIDGRRERPAVAQHPLHVLVAGHVVRRSIHHPALGAHDRALAACALPDRIWLPGREVNLVLELGLEPRLDDRLGRHDICIDFVSRYSSSPYFPSSRPWPDCL